LILESFALSLHLASVPFLVVPFPQPSLPPASPAVAALLSHAATDSKDTVKTIYIFKKAINHNIFQ